PVPWPGPRQDSAARDTRFLEAADPSVDRGGTQLDPRDAERHQSQRRLANLRTGDLFPFVPNRRTQWASRRSAGIVLVSPPKSPAVDKEMPRTRFAPDWRLQLREESDEPPSRTRSPAAYQSRRG